MDHEKCPVREVSTCFYVQKIQSSATAKVFEITTLKNRWDEIPTPTPAPSDSPNYHVHYQYNSGDEQFCRDQCNRLHSCSMYAHSSQFNKICFIVATVDQDKERPAGEWVHVAINANEPFPWSFDDSSLWQCSKMNDDKDVCDEYLTEMDPDKDKLLGTSFDEFVPNIAPPITGRYTDSAASD